MLNRKKYIDEITTKLGWIKNEVSLRTSLNLLDLNIHMEHFVLGLLNLTYGYQLENLNKTQTNYASIDLGDSSRRIAIQITSDNDSQKIKETLSKFFERKYNEKYDRVIVLIIGDKKKYTTSFAVPDGFNFSKDTDIWDFTTLVKDISQKETTELHQIASYFEQELAPVAGYVGSGVYSIAEDMKNKTRALSVAKLMTPGLSKEVAEKIIKADIASNKYQYILDEVSQGKHYLVGGYGSGKSHAALVLCQRLLEQYTVGAFDALPMYTHVRDIVSAGSIQSWVDKKTTNNKYILFIDGLDEISYSIASQITEEVLYLSALKPENALIVCSRPLTYLPDKTNQISVQPLSVAEQEELIGFISDEDVIKFFPHTIEPDLKSCIEIPLFCIIYALLKGTGKLGWVKNKIDLLTAFIDNSTKRIVELNSDLYKDLTAISICATNNGYCDVHISEVTLTSSIDEILKTGLVEKQGEYVFFPLIIIAQFLAAKALQDNAVDRKTVSSSRASIERWRYPISILFSQASFDDTFSFFSEVFYSAPGLAAQIIKDGIKTEKNHSLPNAHLCGEKIVACMNAWTNILGDLSEYIVPTNHGELKTLGIHSEKTYLSYAWYESKNRDSIIEYPSVNSMFGVGTIHSQPVAAQSTWPWIITFEMISRTLQENIDAQTILADCCQLNKEAFWETASLLLNRGSLNFSNINTDQFEHLRGIPGKVINLKNKRVYVDSFFVLLDRMIMSGVQTIEPPFPTGDNTPRSGYVWSFYSKEQYMELVRFVYTLALEEYLTLTKTVFSRFSADLFISKLAPCKLVGNLQFDPCTGDRGAPILRWHLMALPRTSQNIIDIEYRDNDSTEKLFSEIINNRKEYRPEMGEKGIITSGEVLSLSCFKPVTKTVFKWLASELKSLGWIENYRI